jgi:hypothetical protein
LKRFINTVTIIILSFTGLAGQTKETDKYVQVSGIIVDELHMPVAGVAVISKKLRKSAVSERTGIYSITSTPGDTVYFRALGFKRYHTIIPEDYKEKHCNVDIVLDIDTISISEVTIFPWKNYSEFMKDMTKERAVDPIIQNMNDNIASIYVAIANQTNLKGSPEAGYRYAMEQIFSANATKNQFPINNLLNPFAWAKFVNSIKNGLFKSQKFNKPVDAKVRKKVRKPQK